VLGLVELKELRKKILGNILLHLCNYSALLKGKKKRKKTKTKNSLKLLITLYLNIDLDHLENVNV